MKTYANFLMWLFEDPVFQNAAHIKVGVYAEFWTDFFAMDASGDPVAGMGYESDFLAKPFVMDFEEV